MFHLVQIQLVNMLIIKHAAGVNHCNQFKVRKQRTIYRSNTQMRRTSANFSICWSSRLDHVKRIQTTIAWNNVHIIMTRWRIRDDLLAHISLNCARISNVVIVKKVKLVHILITQLRSFITPINIRQSSVTRISINQKNVNMVNIAPLLIQNQRSLFSLLTILQSILISICTISKQYGAHIMNKSITETSVSMHTIGKTLDVNHSSMLIPTSSVKHGIPSLPWLSAQMVVQMAFIVTWVMVGKSLNITQLILKLILVAI